MKIKLLIYSLFLVSSLSFAKTNIACERAQSLLDQGSFKKHYLNFVNFAYRFKGRCRGHALVTQKTYYLMEFNKGENPHKCSPKNFTTECEAFYYDKFAKLFFEDKVIEIPGFKNLHEFSSIPYIEGLLKYHVSRTPTTFQTLEAHNRFLDKEINPSVAHFKEAVERIQEHHRPYIAISSFWTGDHALIGYKFVKDKKSKSGFKLCVRDPNLIPNDKLNCENYLYLNTLETKIPAQNIDESPTIKITDEVFYHKRGEKLDRHLYTVRVYTEEDERIKNYTQSRKQYCLKQIKD